MAFPPKKDHKVPLAAAAAMTKRHRSANAGGVNGHFMSRDAFDAILGQPGCAGIRLYHAVDDSGAPTLAAVGVDGAGKDMTSGAIMENTLPCPPYCDPDSALVK